MEADARRDTLLDFVRAALDGVAAAIDGGELDGAHVLSVLQVVGDALRASVPVPPALRRWLRNCGDDALRKAAGVLSDERRSWSLPAAREESPALGFAVRRRDEAQSALAALEWRFVTASPGTALERQLDELERGLREFDAALGARCTFAEAEALLGTRALLDDRGWRACLPDDRPETERAIGEVSVVPGPEIIDAWLRDGQFHRFVQCHAGRDADFGARLCELVDAALRDAREDRTLPVGFVAQRWRQLQRPVVARPTIVAPLFERRRLSAATEANAPQRTTVHLGMLAPMRASARIDGDGATATLSVYAEPGALRSVAWGGGRADAASVDEVWRVTIPAPSEPVPALLIAADGTRLEFDIDVAPASD